MLDQALNSRVEAVLSRLDEALSAGDVDAAAGLFHVEGCWRDLVSFTWNLKTMEGRGAIKAMLGACLKNAGPSRWRIAEGEAATMKDGAIEAFIAFETQVARGAGHIRLKDGAILTLLTTMAELKGHEEKAGFTRPLGAKHGVEFGAKTWRERREAEIAELGARTQPYVVVIGGGQGAIGLGARLRQLEVPTIILEQNERPGDSWRKRYKTLCLHDPVWYDHLPYIDFPANWPVFSPKDKIADWLEMYAKVMELNYWGGTRVTSAKFDEVKKEWQVTAERAGKTIEMHPKHVVFATGMSGKPHVPKIAGAETFEGNQHHSSAHPGPDAYRNKKAVVIGSNNSAHDIAAALYEAGADVTMVQRSSTLVARSDTLMEVAVADLYSERALRAGMTTFKADMILASVPYCLQAERDKPTWEKIRSLDAEFYKALEAAGFWLDFGADDSGLWMKYVRRGSGYYIDVGASQLVIDGKIKLVRGQVAQIEPEAVVLENGRSLPADLIVYATGYGSMNGFIAELVDQETADKVGKVWGLGSDTPKDPGPWEGELRNLWKPTPQEALWLHGGNLHQSRHYSQFLALQLKARMEGIATPVYGLEQSRHTS